MLTENILKMSLKSKSLFLGRKVTWELPIWKVVFTTFLLVCFVFLKEKTCETRKNVFVLVQKLFSFLR